MQTKPASRESLPLVDRRLEILKPHFMESIGPGAWCVKSCILCTPVASLETVFDDKRQVYFFSLCLEDTLFICN
jgi:hypothetical protein